MRIPNRAAPPPSLSLLLTTLALAVATSALGASPAAPQQEGAVQEEASAFEQVLVHYEAARQALTNDSTEGVGGHGEEIGVVLAGLEADWSAERAGVAAEAAGTALELLPELRRAAEALAAADSLDTARDAFYALSKPLVRWRKAATGERPVVAYCAMAERSWLQPDGELGNPYHGRSMPRCGEVVDP